jgi:alpha-beta hydrolase superfamily lysophospholipase
MTPGKIAVRGGDLYTETFAPAGAPKGSVLVSHGYMEHCGRYHELASVLTKAGWAVMTYDVRGHGKSFGRRGYVDRFDQYLDDLRTVLDTTRVLAPGAPAVLLGHSHGSLITLRALCGDSPPDVAAAIVSSPYLAAKLAVPAYKKLAGRIASRLAPKLSIPEKLPVSGLTSDPEKQKEHEADKLCFDLATARWFTEATAAQAYVEQHADRIRVPMTWLVGGADPICDASVSRRVASKVPGAVYVDFPEMVHEVFNERGRGRVFTEVEKALDAVVHGAARRPASA